LALVTMKELLEAGVHFGHQTRRWNPKMKKFIYGGRNGIYIIDLHQTLRKLDEAYAFMKEVAANGGQVLFVGTKKQAHEAVQEAATRCGMFYVNERWLGGMLTNWRTIQERVARLKELRQMRDDGTFTTLPKKEVMRLTDELNRLERMLSGIEEMKKPPDAVFLIDLKKERIALLEARKLEIPVVAVVDTNCDPDEVDYVIPGNDDAIRAIKLLSGKMADAVLEGRMEREAQEAKAAAEAEEEQAAAEARAAEAEAAAAREEPTAAQPEPAQDAAQGGTRNAQAPEAGVDPTAGGGGQTADGGEVA